MTNENHNTTPGASINDLSDALERLKQQVPRLSSDQLTDILIRAFECLTPNHGMGTLEDMCRQQLGLPLIDRDSDK
jgi:hypothetical protein